MPLDPKDFILPSYVVDAHRFNTIMGGAVTQAALYPTTGLSNVIEAGGAMRSLLNPSNALLGPTAVTPGYLGSAYSSLTAFQKPYDALATVITAQPFASTLNTLASVGSIGTGVSNLLASSAITAGSLASTTVPLGTAAFQVGVADSVRLAGSVTSPYLASSAAVFSLESSYSKLLGSTQLLATEARITGGMIGSLQSNVLGISASLRSTWEAVRLDSAVLSSATVPLLRSPAVELYTATQAAAVFSLPESQYPETDDEVEAILDEAVDEFESRLGSLHQSLIETYRGGLDALQRGRPDWRRHTMVSFRELSTHVLHLLAPEEKILPNAAAGDLQNGRPTRKARLNFIFAEVAGPAIAKFYDADMKAAIELFDLLNDGTHRLEQSATPEQVRYIRGRVVGLIAAMLEAAGY